MRRTVSKPSTMRSSWMTTMTADCRSRATFRSSAEGFDAHLGKPSPVADLTSSLAESGHG